MAELVIGSQAFSVMSMLTALYQNRDAISKGLSEALLWWDRPRSVPGLKVSSLLFGSKAGKTAITTLMKNSSDVAFIDVDDIATKQLNGSDDKPDELKEVDVIDTIKRLVDVKKQTFKHIVLISGNHQRLKRCGAQRTYVCYPSPKFMKDIQKNNSLDQAAKEQFYASHSMLSFYVSKYFKQPGKIIKRIILLDRLFMKNRCFIYDSIKDLEKTLRIVYEVKTSP